VQGWIPAIYYGHNRQPKTIEIDALEFTQLVRAKKTRNLFNLGLTDEGGGEAVAIIKEIQRDIIDRKKFLHIDFQRVAMDEKVTVGVPVELTGLPPIGVKEMGGVLQHPAKIIRVECLPANIPDKILVDVSMLKIGDSIHVRDIVVSNAVIKDSPDEVVAVVIVPTAEEVKAPEPTAEGAEGAEGAAPAEGAEGAEVQFLLPRVRKRCQAWCSGKAGCRGETGRSCQIGRAPAGDAKPARMPKAARRQVTTRATRTRDCTTKPSGLFRRKRPAGKAESSFLESAIGRQVQGHETQRGFHGGRLPVRLIDKRAYGARPLVRGNTGNAFGKRSCAREAPHFCKQVRGGIRGKRIAVRRAAGVGPGDRRRLPFAPGRHPDQARRLRRRTQRLASIRERCGENFPRLRMGIGPLPAGAGSVDFVLGKFDERETPARSAALGTTAEAATVFCTGGIDAAMNLFNRSR